MKNLSGKYKIVILPSAKRDRDKIKAVPALKKRVDGLLAILMEDPFQNPPPYEKLRGPLSSFYSRRINIQHRLVYDVDEELKIVRIVAMWSHYETL